MYRRIDLAAHRSGLKARPGLVLLHDVLTLLAAVINTTVVADENLTVGSTVWLPAESVAPGPVIIHHASST